MKKLKLLVFFLLLIMIPIFIINNKKLDKKKEIIKVEDILNKIPDDLIDEDFITWLENNYNKSILIEIDSYLRDNDYNEDIWHLLTGYSLTTLSSKYNNDMDNVTEIESDGKTATLNFIGDVSLADNWYIMPQYDKRNKGIYGILSNDIVNIFKNDDVTIANSEFTVSSRGAPLKNKYYTFRGNEERLKIYDEMGVDLVTLANNHVYDYGLDAFNDMIDSFNLYDIPYIGAGKNLEEAKKIYYFIVNGYKIAFVNATRAEKYILTPEATEDSAGVLRCYDTTIFKEVIKKAKENSDYVIALVHYGKEDSHELEDVQISSSHEYIESGADIVIGTHAHTLQGIEFYNNKPIIYNLGDFIFNSDDKDTGIFQIKLDEYGNMKYYFLPAHQKNEYTYLLDNNDLEYTVSNMNKWSINAYIDNNLEIKEIN